MAILNIQYVQDENGQTTGVIVPIELWRELIGEKETAYLLQSDAMKKRLMEAKNRDYGVSVEEARENLGI